MTSSRYVRPARLPPLQLQPRDLEVFAAIYHHRYLSAEHLGALVFPSTARRRVQRRLRTLWAHRYLHRKFIPYDPDGVHLAPETAGRPFYMLAARGAQRLAAQEELELGQIPHTRRANARGYATMEHNLVVTDFLVSLEVALRGQTDVVLEAVEHEHRLRQQFSAWKMNGAHAPSALVPDGAFTLSYSGAGRPLTFYLEVVRADVKGGNKTLLRRMQKYVIANRAGVFRRVYGHDLLRAVLILTTSPERADHFRALAAELPTSRALFWFGTFQSKDKQGRCLNSLTPENILSPRWMNTDGQLMSLIPAAIPTI